MSALEIVDPFKGKKYSATNPKGAPVPTHPLLKIAGTGKAAWDAQLERWVV